MESGGTTTVHCSILFSRFDFCCASPTLRACSHHRRCHCHCHHHPPTHPPPLRRHLRLPDDSTTLTPVFPPPKPALLHFSTSFIQFCDPGIYLSVGSTLQTNWGLHSLFAVELVKAALARASSIPLLLCDLPPSLRKRAPCFCCNSPGQADPFTCNSLPSAETELVYRYSASALDQTIYPK